MKQNSGKEKKEKPFLHGNTYHVNDVKWTSDGHGEEESTLKYYT